MRLFLWVILAFAFGLGTAAAVAKDVAGSRDHPIIERYPGSTIEWYLVENYRQYKIPAGPVSGYRELAKWIPSEGRLTRIYYALDGGARSDSEVYKNYRDALAGAGFEILAEGYVPEGVRGGSIGSREWQDVIYRANPWGDKSGAVNEISHGSATSAGSGSIVAHKQREAGTAYVVVSVYQFREDRVATLVDVLEVEGAKTGLITVNAEAIGAGINEQGRVVLDGLFFDFDKATLTQASKPALDEIAKYLAANPTRAFYVVGHTDSKGELAYNQKLSSDRAAAVVGALTRDYKIAANRLLAHGVGPLAPRSTNAADAGRELNRRVELVER